MRPKQENSYEILRSTYENIIKSVVATTQDFETLLGEVHEKELIIKHGFTPKVFETFRERADSELLSIAFFGAFSSGKSFLISNLNEKVDWYKHQGRDQYAPLLPASSRHTSSCPVAVEPLAPRYREDRFWVWFEGSKNWEEKSPAIEAVIQAYVTDLPNAKSKRLSNKDRTREVLKAKLGIASAIMKARFYDLPGIGAVGVNYEDLIREFVQQADCLVYIAWAVRPIDEKELELLREVYNHHKATGKPVFFVLTQIDRNWDYETASGNVGWEEVLQANNEFLDKYFVTSKGTPDTAFIGEGFIPVSAALEVKGRELVMQEPDTSKKFMEESRMHMLRERFNEYLQHTSGPMHLAELASEIQRLLTRLVQDIQSREESESTPLEKARSAIKGYKAQRSTLMDGKNRFEENLTRLGGSAIKRALAGSDPDYLAQLLSERLREKVRNGNVLKESVIHEIETEKASIVREWISRDNKALIPRWVGAWDAFVTQSNERLENLLLEARIAQRQAMEDEAVEEADMASVDIPDRLKTRYEDPRPATFKEAIDVLSTTWKTWSLVAGVGASGIISSIASAAVIPTMAVLGPIGWGIIASATIGAGFGKWRLVQKLEDRRIKMLESLPEYSQTVVRSYQHQADEFIRSHIGIVIEILDNEIERLNSSINSLEQRLLTGEYVNREQRLRTLKRLSQQCLQVENRINEFYTMASSIQPRVEKIVHNSTSQT